MQFKCMYFIWVYVRNRVHTFQLTSLFDFEVQIRNFPLTMK